MKKVLMGSVFAMILAAGITTSLAAPNGYCAADRDGICDYAAQSPAGLTSTRTMTASVIMPIRALAGALWTRITMVSATMPDRVAAAMRTAMASVTSAAAHAPWMAPATGTAAETGKDSDIKRGFGVYAE